MKKLLFSGICLETGETLTGSLIQFEDGTHIIMFKEEDGKGFTSPVDPDTVKPVSLIKAQHQYNCNYIDDPDHFSISPINKSENLAADQISYLLSLVD